MKISFKLFILFILASCVAILLINGSDINYLGAAVFLVFLPIFFIRPNLYFMFFVFIRPIIDIFLKENSAGSQLSTIAVIPLIILCGKEIFLNRANLHKVINNGFLRNFNKIFGLFLCMALLSLFNTMQIIVSLADFFRLVSIMISVNYAVIYFTGDKNRTNKFILAVLLSSFIPMGFGLFQYFHKNSILENCFNRIYGTFSNSNVFAEYLLLVIFVAIYMLSQFKNRKMIKIAIVFFTIFALFSLYNTFTRTIWIAFAISFIVYVFLKRGLSRKAIYFLAISIIFLILLPRIQDRFEDVSGRRFTEGKNSLEWRIALWNETSKDLRKHPFIGNGLGMFEYRIGVAAHNDFLRTAYETGIPAAIIFYSLFIYLIFYCFRRYVTSLDADSKDRFNLALCLIIGLLVSSMAINTFRNTVIMFFYFSTIVIIIQQKMPAI